MRQILTKGQLKYILDRPTCPISVYRASAPVVHKKTLPRIIKPALLSGLSRTCAAYTGLNARKIERSPSVIQIPVPPRNKNHTIIAGPNILPMELVPLRWIINRMLMIASVITTTRCCPGPRKLSTTSMLRKPSTAVVTVTAGVRTPSASMVQPPIIVGTISHFPQSRIRL